MVGGAQEALPLSLGEEAYHRGVVDGRRHERESIDGFLASWFAQQDPAKVDQSTWQDVLNAVGRREYLRGLAEGRADD
jgi:hypothetical protein